MTLQELYERIGGSYEDAKRIMMADSIIGRMIVKYPDDPGCANLKAAAETLDPGAMFEAAHAIKGVSANLGLTKIYALACVLSDEFRAGNPRTMTDDEVRAMVDEVCRLDDAARAAIRDYM